MNEEIRRGNIYMADLGERDGSEQGGSRPVLVLQNNAGNRHCPTVIVAPITTKLKKLKQPTHVILETSTGLEHTSLVLLEQITTIGKQRLDWKIGTVDEDAMKKVNRAIRISLASGGERHDHRRKA